MSKVVKFNIRDKELFEQFNNPSVENIKSYVSLKISKGSLTDTDLKELKQTLSFRGNKFSYTEYYYLREGKKIWVENDWVLKNGYYVFSFYCDSYMSTNEISRLSEPRYYELQDSILSDKKIFVYYTNSNLKVGYLELSSGSTICGYMCENYRLDNVMEHYREYEVKSKHQEDDEPFWKSIKKHTVTFEEYDHEHCLDSNPINNRRYSQYDMSGREITLDLSKLNFNKSKSVYSFWINTKKMNYPQFSNSLVDLEKTQFMKSRYDFVEQYQNKPHYG